MNKPYTMIFIFDTSWRMCYTLLVGKHIGEKHMKEIKKQYNQFASIYSDGRRGNEPSIKHFGEVLKGIDFQCKKVLDVGCGAGQELVEYERRGAESTYGIDSSDEMIQLSKVTSPRSVLHVGNMEELPYGDAEFDLVLSKYAIQTSEDVPGVLKEIARVLKPGGTLLYLSKHPFRQFMEKPEEGRDYFVQEVVTSRIFGGTIVLQEPSHTIGEYFSAEFYRNFAPELYEEESDFPASEQIGNQKYPCYFIVQAVRR